MWSVSLTSNKYAKRKIVAEIIEKQTNFRYYLIAMWLLYEKPINFDAVDKMLMVLK